MVHGYKADKEAFVSGLTGSSISHVNIVSAVALCSIALYSALRSRLPAASSLVFPAEWLILIAPLLLSITVFANSAGLLILILLFPTALLMLIPPRESGTPLPSNSEHSPSSHRSMSPQSQSTHRSFISQLPALTTYRSHMMILTIFCILAVDFPIFPRFLAKCETYGVSLMDLGVGSFVFSQGIVSAIPILKNPAYLSAPIVPKAISTLRENFPLLCLGLLRVLFVKGTEYPEHETEYGVHWNFFITLGALPVLQVLLHPFMACAPISVVGAVVASLHQFSLSSFGMRDYVFSAPRTNLVSANKEGIVSLVGYLSIHIIGLSIGTTILPPTPSFFRRQQRLNNPSHRRNSNATQPQSVILRENDKTAIELCSYAILWWTFLGLSFVLKIDFGVSRQLVNIPYILWISAFNTSFILGYFLLDLYFFPSPLSKSIYSPTSKLKVHPDSVNLPVETQQASTSPVLLEAINKNGLWLFLLANVTTGLINMSFRTMHMSDGWAMVILSVYGFGVCLIAWMTKDKRLWKL